MTKKRQFFLTTAIGLVVAAVAFWLCWRPLAVELMSRDTAREFKRVLSSEEPDKKVKMTLDEWAWRFGGKAGLGRLRELASDADLAPAARIKAAQLRDKIASGAHLPYLRRIVAASRGEDTGVPPRRWPTSAMIEYIYERDSR